MASCKACLVATLCSLIILSTFIGSTQSASCCLNYIRHRISCSRILDYYIQTINGSCDINAIIFHIRGRFVCGNPLEKWVQRGMRCINHRMKRDVQSVKEEAPATPRAA